MLGACGKGVEEEGAKPRSPIGGSGAGCRGGGLESGKGWPFFRRGVVGRVGGLLGVDDGVVGLLVPTAPTFTDEELEPGPGPNVVESD